MLTLTACIHCTHMCCPNVLSLILVRNLGMQNHRGADAPPKDDNEEEDDADTGDDVVAPVDLMSLVGGV